MNISRLVYFDGNGNSYNISKDSISYNPIKPEMSSSGIYDGGIEIHKTINETDFKNLLLIFDSIFSNSRIQIKNRIKTSGVLVRYDKEKIIDQIIISKSDEQLQLEEKLKSLSKE